MDRDEDKFTGLPVTAAPVVAVSIVCNLGGSRQMNLNAHFGRDDPPEVQNAVLDRVMRIADRQKAIYDLEEMETNFRTVGLNLSNLLAARGVAENVAKLQIAQLTAKLAGQEEGRREIRDSDYAAFAQSGRRGSYEPRGAVKQRLAVADADIQKTRDAIAAAPADAAQERDKLRQTITRTQDDLRIRRKTINELRALAGRPPLEDYLAEETADPFKE